MAYPNPSRLPRRGVIIIAIIAVMLAATLAAGLYLHMTAQATSKPIKLSGLYWIYYREDLARLEVRDPAIIGQTIAGPGTYALEHNNSGTPLPAGVKPAELFFSYADQQAAIKNGTVIPGVSALAYDPEDWPATPPNEQQNPLTYMKEFGSASSAGGYQTIMIPGRDLMLVPGAGCGQQQGESISQAYVRCGLPSAAQYADIYVIQSASLETDLPAMTQLVQQASAAARAANPGVKVIATLATTPNGAPVGAGTINRDARAILPYVQGFEINTTAATDARIVTFLHDLAGS